MINYNRIKKECFWDFKFSDEELKALACSENFRERDFLFQKILLNSQSLFNDLKIFEIDTLKELIRLYKVPPFNSKYIFKRKNMVEVYFLDMPLMIDELKWQI
jgi:hypothetical protein